VAKGESLRKEEADIDVVRNMDGRKMVCSVMPVFGLRDYSGLTTSAREFRRGSARRMPANLATVSGLSHETGLGMLWVRVAPPGAGGGVNSLVVEKQLPFRLA
jgi:hypothetical protein